MLYTLIGFLLLLTYSCSTTVEHLNSSEIESITKCDISLKKAKNNLVKVGFEIDNYSNKSFETKGFKESQYQHTTYLFGSPYENFFKKFTVLKTGEKSISYKVSYKNKIPSHLADELVETKTVEKKELFLRKHLENLNKIKEEICGSPQPTIIQVKKSKICDKTNIDRCLIDAYKELAKGNKLKSKALFENACQMKNAEACAEMKKLK